MTRKHIGGSSMVALLMACSLAAAVAAQQPQTPPAGSPPAAPGAQGGRGRGSQPPVAYEDYTGFTKLWDGATFTNWDGERDVWTIEDGMLHADTVKTPGQHHIHYIGPNAVMRDFDLKVEFKIGGNANGGIQYRSRMLHTVHGGTMDDPMGKPTPAGVTTMAQAVAAGVTTTGGGGGGGGGNRAAGAPGAGAPGAGGGGGNRGGAPAGAPAAAPPSAAAAAPAAPAAPPNPMARCSTAGGPQPTSNPATPTSTGNIWQVSGYQFDLNLGNNYTGQLYEGQGRSIVAAPGTFVRLTPAGPVCVAVINENPASAVKPHLGKDGEWQQVEIIARGNTLVHIINGHVLTVAIDENPTFRALKGILSLQLEGSGQIWYRNVYVKMLDQ